MNIEEEINKIRHEEYVKFWADKAENLSIYNEAMKLELAKPEADEWASKKYLQSTRQILSYGGAVSEELGWKQFADAMPNLAKEMKENFDKLESKVWTQVQDEWAATDESGKAKLPWYKRWFA